MEDCDLLLVNVARALQMISYYVLVICLHEGSLLIMQVFCLQYALLHIFTMKHSPVQQAQSASVSYAMQSFNHHPDVPNLSRVLNRWSSNLKPTSAIF